MTERRSTDRGRTGLGVDYSTAQPAGSQIPTGRGSLANMRSATIVRPSGPLRVTITSTDDLTHLRLVQARTLCGARAIGRISGMFGWVALERATCPICRRKGRALLESAETTLLATYDHAIGVAEAAVAQRVEMAWEAVELVVCGIAEAAQLAYHGDPENWTADEIAEERAVQRYEARRDEFGY